MYPIKLKFFVESKSHNFRTISRPTPLKKRLTSISILRSKPTVATFPFNTHIHTNKNMYVSPFLTATSTLTSFSGRFLSLSHWHVTIPYSPFPNVSNDCRQRWCRLHDQPSSLSNHSNGDSTCRCMTDERVNEERAWYFLIQICLF